MTQYVLVATSWLNIEGVMSFFRELKRSYNRNSEIRITVKELSKLSDRELNDIGIARGDIYSIAREDADFKRFANTKTNNNLEGWV